MKMRILKRIFLKFKDYYAKDIQVIFNRFLYAMLYCI